MSRREYPSGRPHVPRNCHANSRDGWMCERKPGHLGLHRGGDVEWSFDHPEWRVPNEVFGVLLDGARTFKDLRRTLRYRHDTPTLNAALRFLVRAGLVVNVGRRWSEAP